MENGRLLFQQPQHSWLDYFLAAGLWGTLCLTEVGTNDCFHPNNASDIPSSRKIWHVGRKPTVSFQLSYICSADESKCCLGLPLAILLSTMRTQLFSTSGIGVGFLFDHSLHLNLYISKVGHIKGLPSTTAM